MTWTNRFVVDDAVAAVVVETFREGFLLRHRTCAPVCESVMESKRSTSPESQVDDVADETGHSLVVSPPNSSPDDDDEKAVVAVVVVVDANAVAMSPREKATTNQSY